MSFALLSLSIIVISSQTATYYRLNGEISTSGRVRNIALFMKSAVSQQHNIKNAIVSLTAVRNTMAYLYRSFSAAAIAALHIIF